MVSPGSPDLETANAIQALALAASAMRSARQVALSLRPPASMYCSAILPRERQFGEVSYFEVLSRTSISVAQLGGDRLGRSLQDLCGLLRAAQPGHRPVPASAGHRHHDAGGQGHVPDDGRVRRVRARNDPRAGEMRALLGPRPVASTAVGPSSTPSWKGASVMHWLLLVAQGCTRSPSSSALARPLSSASPTPTRSREATITFGDFSPVPCAGLFCRSPVQPTVRLRWGGGLADHLRGAVHRCGDPSGAGSFMATHMTHLAPPPWRGFCLATPPPSAGSLRMPVLTQRRGLTADRKRGGYSRPHDIL
jgi:hypothetical protein